MAATRFETARPLRKPNTRFCRTTFSGKILRSAAVVAWPTYSSADDEAVLERRTLIRAEPSCTKVTSRQRRLAASERLSSASLMTEAMAMSMSPRRRAVSSDSVRPVGPVRGSRAVPRTAASAAAVSPWAWRDS